LSIERLPSGSYRENIKESERVGRKEAKTGKNGGDYAITQSSNRKY
jgi:hypothetical protein